MLVAVVASALVVALAAVMPSFLVQDSWLSFVDGRLVAEHWLPHADTLTATTLGRPWIDQQWLAHLVLYELAAHGGLRAALAFGLLCVVASLIVVAVAARKLGASSRSVALTYALPLLATPWLVQLRAQSFALVLFAAVYGLLVLDARRPSRRVLLVLPLLVVWANLHGSVALGAGLVALQGLRLVAARHVRRGLLLVAAPVCLLASPYGYRLVAYYRLMLLQPPLAHFVQEWKPTPVDAATAVFFATAIALVVVGAANRRVLTSFEWIALPVLLVAALAALRNTVWFELAAALALPRLVDAVWSSRAAASSRQLRLNKRIALGAVAVAVLAVVVAMARPASRFEDGSPSADAATVAAVAGAHGTVLADDAHADWLLWLQPSLAGRVDYDVRFELFSTAELRQIERLHDGRPGPWRRCGSTAAVVTFGSPAAARATLRAGLLRPGAHLIVSTPAFAAVAQTPARGPCVL